MTSSSKRRAGEPPLTRRVKAVMTDPLPFQVTNVTNGEVIYNNCLLICGSAPLLGSSSETDFVLVRAKDELQTGVKTITWPSGSIWTALVCLKPGKNSLTFELHQAKQMMDIIKLTLVYQPLLQIPPVHLAILVAKDSPLTIDCPPSKFGNIATAHSGIKAAISKLRTTACMWQALTAEELRLRGVGRRAFRLEEEWAAPGESQIKVHIIRSERTVEELQSQPNSLPKHFLDALKSYGGGHFSSAARPIIAGLVLDVQYSVSSNSVRGSVQSGQHDTDGFSLAVFSSEMTHSWPRSISEVAECLTDDSHLGDLVSTDRISADKTSLSACAYSQASFLCQLGKSMGVTKNWGPGVEREWIARFVAPSGEDAQAASETEVWSLAHALNFKTLPHFRIPGDEPLAKEFRAADIEFGPETDDNDEDVLKVFCRGSALAKVVVTNGLYVKTFDLMHQGRETVTLNLSETQLTPFTKESPLKIYALALNGKERSDENAWRLFDQKDRIVLPRTATSRRVVLFKRGTENHDVEKRIHHGKTQLVPWAMFLHRIDAETNKLVPADKIELRVGACFDGAYVRYKDGSHANCGPEYRSGSRFTFGGNTYTQTIPAGVYITKVKVGGSAQYPQGIKMTLSNGQTWGTTNSYSYGGPETPVELAAGPGERIVGFYGTSNRPGRGYVCDFGIIVANVSDLDKDGQLPLAAYQLDCVKTSGRYEGDGGPVEGVECGHPGCVEYYRDEERRNAAEEDSDEGSDEDSDEDFDDEDTASEDTVE